MNNQIELPFIKNRKAYSPKGVINLIKEAERDNNGKLNEIFRNKHNYKQLVEMWHASFLALSIYKWLGKKFFLFPSDAPDIYFLEEDTNNAFQLEIMELYNFNNKEFDNDYKKLVSNVWEKKGIIDLPKCHLLLVSRLSMKLFNLTKFIDEFSKFSWKFERIWFSIYSEEYNEWKFFEIFPKNHNNDSNYIFYNTRKDIKFLY